MRVWRSVVGKELEKNPLRPLAVTFTKKNNAHARKKKTEGGEQGETQGYKNARAGRLGGERRGCGRAGRTQRGSFSSLLLLEAQELFDTMETVTDSPEEETIEAADRVAIAAAN